MLFRSNVGIWPSSESLIQNGDSIVPGIAEEMTRFGGKILVDLEIHDYTQSETARIRS